MTRRKKQAYALRGTAVAGDQASEERFAEITSGSRSEKLGRGVAAMLVGILAGESPAGELAQLPL
jgi:hypothetical protein